MDTNLNLNLYSEDTLYCMEVSRFKYQHDY